MVFSRQEYVAYYLAKNFENSTIGNTMDRPWRHYAKWNMSNREGQIDNIIYMWNLKQYQTHKKERDIRLVITRSEG